MESGNKLELGDKSKKTSRQQDRRQMAFGLTGGPTSSLLQGLGVGFGSSSQPRQHMMISGFSSPNPAIPSEATADN